MATYKSWSFKDHEALAPNECLVIDVEYEKGWSMRKRGLYVNFRLWRRLRGAFAEIPVLSLDPGEPRHKNILVLELRRASPAKAKRIVAFMDRHAPSLANNALAGAWEVVISTMEEMGPL